MGILRDTNGNLLYNVLPPFTGEDVIELARDWLDTPYHHQQHVKGKDGGVDCIGLIIGVHDELYNVSAGEIPVYTRWWAEDEGEELMVTTIRNHRHCVEITVPELTVGDIFIMRMKETGPAKHSGFISTQGRIIHAYSGHAVAETDLPWSWKRRIRYAFRFKQTPD